MKPLIALFAVLALAGCATTGSVPSSLLECADQPSSPAANAGATQADVGIYVIDLAEAGADCRSKLGAVRRILEPNK